MTKVFNFLRGTIAVQTPRWYSIEDEFYTTLNSNFSFGSYASIPTDLDGSSLGVLVSKYKLITPPKTSVGIGFQLGKVGILGFECESVFYEFMRLREGQNGYDFFDENLKTGGEIRFNQVSLRGGFAYFPSPFDKGELNEESDNMNFSAGIGIREKNFYIDLGTVYMLKNEKYNLYNDPGGSNVANLKNRYLKVLATIGFRF
jgi:hypothetical protein